MYSVHISRNQCNCQLASDWSPLRLLFQQCFTVENNVTFHWISGRYCKSPYKIIIEPELNYLLEQLVKCGSPGLMQKRYFHSLKQALFLLYGNARLFASLSLQSRVDLWEGICRGERNA